MDISLEVGLKILQVTDLFMSFRGLVALNGIGFSVEKGEIFGLIGTNGSGKSTFFNCVNHLYQPQRGKITYKGKHDLLSKRSHQIAKMGIARTFQNLELFHYTRVLENIMVGLHPRLDMRRYLRKFTLKALMSEWEADKNEAFKILNFLGITRFHSRLVTDLPYGLQKLIELGRALAAQPDLLLLDEPSAGMNESESKEVARLIKSIRDDFGCTILLVEHDMNLVQSICDRLCVLDSGEIVTIGRPDEIVKDPKVIRIFLGEESDA